MYKLYAQNVYIVSSTLVGFQWLRMKKKINLTIIFRDIRKRWSIGAYRRRCGRLQGGDDSVLSSEFVEILTTQSVRISFLINNTKILFNAQRVVYESISNRCSVKKIHSKSICQVRRFLLITPIKFDVEFVISLWLWYNTMVFICL